MNYETWKQQLSKSEVLAILSEGTIVTPFPLIEEIVDKLPIQWDNPNMKFLDPACGRGSFLFVIKHRLMQYHSEQHVVENMLYGVDISDKNVAVAKAVLNSENKYNDNIECGNSLTKEWDMKFDVVCGNPPYSENNVGKGGNASLYQQFSLLAHELSLSIVAFITPGTFKRQRKFEALRGKMNERGVYEIKSLPLDTFANATVDDPSYWITVAGTKKTVEDYVFDEYDLVLAKMCLVNKPMMNWRGGQAPVFNETHSDKLSKTMQETFVNPYVDRIATTGPVVVYSTDKLHKPIERGVFIPQRSNDTPTIVYLDTPHSFSQNVLACECSYEEAEYFKENVRTNICRFLLKVSARTVRGARNKKNQPYPHTSGQLNMLLPKLFVEKTWTDAELYTHFNLTEEEIALIESTIK